MAPHSHITLHWAINGTRWARGITVPVVERTVDYNDRIAVHVRRPPADFVTSSTCRIERSGWHNRVHIATHRLVAVDRWLGEMEYGFALCGAHLVNPLYTDDERKVCGCGKGDATLCPRCAIVGVP